MSQQYPGYTATQKASGTVLGMRPDNYTAIVSGLLVVIIGMDIVREMQKSKHHNSKNKLVEFFEEHSDWIKLVLALGILAPIAMKKMK